VLQFEARDDAGGPFLTDRLDLSSIAVHYGTHRGNERTDEKRSRNPNSFLTIVRTHKSSPVSMMAHRREIHQSSRTAGTLPRSRIT
jgi:hypothetical protein